MSTHLHFHLCNAVATAIDIGSAARYPTAPADAPPRMYSIEASRLRRGSHYSVHCAPATAPLIIADIERVRDASPATVFRQQCDQAIATIRAELERPPHDASAPRPWLDFALVDRPRGDRPQ